MPLFPICNGASFDSSDKHGSRGGKLDKFFKVSQLLSESLPACGILIHLVGCIQGQVRFCILLGVGRAREAGGSGWGEAGEEGVEGCFYFSVPIY